MNNKGFTIWTLPAVIVSAGLLFIGGFIAGDYRTSSGHISLDTSIQKMPRQIKAALKHDDNSNLAPLDAFTNVLSDIRSQYYDRGKVAEDELTYSAIEGMLSSLGDPFTRFMDPKEFASMQESTSGAFVGIGAQLDTDPLGAVIKRPIPNSPAAKKGLQVNDVIMKVNNELVAGKAIEAIVKMIRGEKGKPVTLTIKRKSIAKPFDVTLIRDSVVSPNMEYFMEDEANKIGRLWLGEFNQKAPYQIDQGLDALESKGMKGLILDLRFNPGGLLDSAIKIASRFENKGPVVIIRGKNGQEETVQPESDLYHEHSYPIVVLVNSNSASASEILSGCLKDHKVALLIGEKTFGKGLVQTVSQLQSNTAAAITTARYLTPNGTDINRKKQPNGRFIGGGIPPDIEVKPTDDWTFNNVKGDKKDIQLLKAIEVLKTQIAAGKQAHSH